MKKAMCVGINNYPGTSSDLQGCVNDANDWADVLQSYGFETEIILDSDATSDNIITKFNSMITQAAAGDVIVFTYSGHGTNVLDTSGDEADGYDEALYVYDGVLLDDKLRESIQKVKQGVHLTVISDSCFSGTVTRALDANVKTRFIATDAIPPGAVKVRAFLGQEDMPDVLLTGCNDNEYSYDAFIDGRYNGAFTANALKVIKANSGQSYLEFYAHLRELLPSGNYPQTPQLEGSTANKNKKMFEPLDATEPGPDPGPEPEPPDETPSSGCLKSVIFMLGIFAMLFSAVWALVLLVGRF